MLLFAQKNQTKYDKLLFILSAGSFNQAYNRFVYLRHYSEYRKRQAELIEWIRDLIQKKVSKLQLQKAEKEILLQSKKQEADKLNKERKQQGQYLTTLQKKQQEFEKKLKEQQKIEAQLNREIQRIIDEEIRKAREREKEKERQAAAAGNKSTGKSTGSGKYEMTPEEKLASDKFEQNRRRLPWPVERGVITDRFGVHEHPVMKNIQVKNDGVDISTAEGVKARAVFAGEVSRVFMVSGGNMAVIIRHGKYLTVYSNLTNVLVKQGDKVATKQIIGTIGTDEEESKTVLKFQIRREMDKLDPEDWIAR
jgi:septal ring factor EnvC (AmiA/AmiB activator)